MKFKIIGIKRIQGVAKSTGSPFDMCRVYCLVPIETSSGKTKVSGYGMEVAELEFLPEVLSQFSGLQFPSDVELKLDQRFMFGEYRSIVVGIEVAPVVRQVAR